MRGKFFVLADVATNTKPGNNDTPISPVAFDKVKRIEVEREINGLCANQRRLPREQESHPVVTWLVKWMRAERAKRSRSSLVVEPIDYMLKRWGGFRSFLDERRICLSNNAADRALRVFAILGSSCPYWVVRRATTFRYRV